MPKERLLLTLEDEVRALRSLVTWATDADVVLAAGTPEEIEAALRAYGREPTQDDGSLAARSCCHDPALGPHSDNEPHDCCHTHRDGEAAGG